MNNAKHYKKGLIDGIPVMLGYLAVSFALGIAAAEVKITSMQAFVMSAGMMASAGEFAAIELIKTNAGAIEIIITCLVVNLRYILMSCSLSQKPITNKSIIHRLGLAYCITDEIFALSFSVNGSLNPFYTYGIMTVAVLGWTSGTVLGVIFGNILPVFIVNSLGVALYGMFIAIIIPPAKENKIICGLIIISMLLSYIFSKVPVLSSLSTGFRIILLTLLVAGFAAYFFPVKDNTEVTSS